MDFGFVPIVERSLMKAHGFAKTAARLLVRQLLRQKIIQQLVLNKDLLLTAKMVKVHIDLRMMLPTNRILRGEHIMRVKYINAQVAERF